MSDLPAIPFNDIERMGKAIAMSKLFGLQTPEQAIALMLIAQAEGLHPAIAARDYHIIQGRPALKADAMLSRFQAAGGKVQWTELTDKRVSAIFSHAQGGSVEIDWTMDRAKQADLGGKDMWKKYPRQMLRSRVISEGIRTVYPGCLVGFYTPEEVIDMEPIQTLHSKEPEPPKEETPPPAKTPEVEAKKHDGLDQKQMQLKIKEMLLTMFPIEGFGEEHWQTELEHLTSFKKGDDVVPGVANPFELNTKPNAKGETRTGVTYVKVRELFKKFEADMGVTDADPA